MIGNNSLLAWDLRFCWLLRKGKLCTEGFELEMFFFYKKMRKAKERESWMKLQLFCILLAGKEFEIVS